VTSQADEPSVNADRMAIGLYAVAARDFLDFIDMIREPQTSMECLQTLLEMCKLERPDRPTTDVELNRMMVGPIEREIRKREGKEAKP
jgi:hypothetical protein